MKYLSIDYGEKRIGLAMSSEEGKLALPYKTLENNSKIFDALKEIVEKEKITEVVVGLPVTFAMQESEQTRAVKDFAKHLQNILKMPVFFENEIFSSKIAEKSSKKGKIDESAAALILQSYLDRKKVHSEMKYNILKEDHEGY